jgi:hypothetical protein
MAAVTITGYVANGWKLSLSWAGQQRFSFFWIISAESRNQGRTANDQPRASGFFWKDVLIGSTRP